MGLTIRILTNVFNDSKYTCWYRNIIVAAADACSARTNSLAVYHKHHIIPRSLGGVDSQDNLVLLSPREHYVCHLLLVKMTEGAARSKMVFAFFRFSPKNSNVISSKSFERFASSFGKTLSGSGNPFYGKKHSAETLQKFSGANHPMFGTNLKEIWRAKFGDAVAEQREAQRLQRLQATRARRPEPLLGTHRTQAQRDHQAMMMRGARNPNFGKDWCFITRNGVNKKVERHTLMQFLSEGWIQGVTRHKHRVITCSPSDR